MPTEWELCINSKFTDVKWPKGTVAIFGDSTISGIREELFKTDKHSVKVRSFRRGTIGNMEDNIKPILRTGLFYPSCPNQQRNKFDSP